MMKIANFLFLAASNVQHETTFLDTFSIVLRMALWGLPILVLLYLFFEKKVIGNWEIRN